MGKRAKWRVVALAGAFRPGEPLDSTVRDAIRVPAEVVDTGERIYRLWTLGEPGKREPARDEDKPPRLHQR